MQRAMSGQDIQIEQVAYEGGDFQARFDEIQNNMHKMLVNKVEPLNR